MTQGGILCLEDVILLYVTAQYWQICFPHFNKSAYLHVTTLNLI